MEYNIKNNNTFNLNHKPDFYLMNSYGDAIENSDWNNNNLINIDDNIQTEDEDFSNEWSNKGYSLLEKKDFKSK